MKVLARTTAAVIASMVVAAGCTVLFDYGERPGDGNGGLGGMATTSGGGDIADGGDGSGGGDGMPCASPEDCPSFDSDGPCQTTTCFDNACGVTNPPAGTPVGMQTAGDCVVMGCTEAGTVDVIVDETDVPVDGLECTQDVCTGDAPSNPPATEGTACGMGGMLSCNTAGECVGCIDDNQCLPDTDCQDHFCDNRVCDVTVASNGTSCTDDGLFCNGVEQCQNGGCMAPGDPCPNADGDGDCSETCDENNDDCNGNDVNGSSCNDGLYCNGSDTCQTGVCSQHGGDPCPGPDGDGDCSETCNEGANNCTANDTNGSTCPSDGVFCNGIEACQSGTCVGAGNPCDGVDGDNDCSETCNEGADNCTANDPNGSSCNDNLYCNGADTCSNGSCASHAGNPCQGSDGDADCSEQCNEAGNNCNGNDPNGSTCNDGLYCNGTDTCTNGSCGLHTGSPCPGPDNDFDCTESCDEGLNNCTADDPDGSSCLSGFEDGICLTGFCETFPF